MRLGLQQGLACLLTARFCFETNCALPPLHSDHIVTYWSCVGYVERVKGEQIGL